MDSHNYMVMHSSGVVHFNWTSSVLDCEWLVLKGLSEIN